MQLSGFTPDDGASAIGPGQRVTLTGLVSDAYTASNAVLFLANQGIDLAAQGSVRVVGSNGEILKTIPISLDGFTSYLQLSDADLFAGIFGDRSDMTVVLDGVTGTSSIGIYATVVDRILGDGAYYPGRPGAAQTSGRTGRTLGLVTNAADFCAGEIAQVAVSMGNAVGTLSAQFDVTYDPAKMTVESATLGALTQRFTIASSLSPGRVGIALAGDGGVASPGGEIVVLQLRAAPDLAQGTTVAMQLENVLIDDDPPSTAGLTLKCRCRAGDVDNNGSVTAYDAALVLESVVGAITLNEAQQCAADYNGNGAISAFDASLILQCVVSGVCR